MDELIKVSYENSDRPTVMGRELHKALGLKTRYNDWFKRMCSYDFAENEDYITLTQKRVTAQGNQTTETDHQLTLSMAKEICMIQRSEIGKKCRRYFIEVERRYKTNAPQLPTQVTENIKTLEKRIEYLEHHAENLISAEVSSGASIAKSFLASIEWEIFLKSIEICETFDPQMPENVQEFITRYIRKELCSKMRTPFLRELPVKLYAPAIRFITHFKPDEHLTQLIINMIFR